MKKWPSGWILVEDEVAAPWWGNPVQGSEQGDLLTFLTITFVVGYLSMSATEYCDRTVAAPGEQERFRLPALPVTT